MRGSSPDGILSGFDLSERFDNFVGVQSAEQQLPEFDFGAFNHVSEALLEEKPAKIHRYRMVDLLHQLAVAARVSDPRVVVGDQLPFIAEPEFMDVRLGVIPDRSLRMPGGRKLTRAIVNQFQEIYPDALLSPCGTELRRGGSEFRLLDVKKLTKSPLPPLTKQLLSEAAATAVARRPLYPREEYFFRRDGPATGAPLTRPQQLAEEEVEGRQNLGVQAGIDHVVRFLDQDVKSLPPAEREIYTYGFPGARAYIERLSPKKKKDLFKHSTVGAYRDVEVITRVSSALKLVVRAELTDEQWALMAGARILNQKGG